MRQTRPPVGTDASRTSSIARSSNRLRPAWGFFFAWKVLEVEMVAEEGKYFVVNAVVGTIPVGIAAPCAVEFFGFMDDAELVELVGERLVGVDVVPYAIAAGASRF